MSVIAAPDLALMRDEYRSRGYTFREGVVSSVECKQIVATVEAHRDKMISVDLKSLILENRFFTINGEELEELVPAVRRLTAELCEVASELEGKRLAPLENKTVGQSLNLTPAGGVLSWHYDRNLVTAVVHLNEVAGGEFECYPRYRVRLRNNDAGARKWVQRVFDVALRPRAVRSLLGHRQTIPPREGGVGLMDSRCLHQVAPVRGNVSRAAIVLCYDEPGKVFSRDRTKNYYGYRDRPAQPYG